MLIKNTETFVEYILYYIYHNIYSICYTNMIYISREAYKRNGVETIVDSNGILRLNERHIVDGLDHKMFADDHRKISFRP